MISDASWEVFGKAFRLLVTFAVIGAIAVVALLGYAAYWAMQHIEVIVK